MEWLSAIVKLVAADPLAGLILAIVLASVGFAAMQVTKILRGRLRNGANSRNDESDKSLIRRVNMLEQRLGTDRLEKHFDRYHDLAQKIQTSIGTAERAERSADRVQVVSHELAEFRGETMARLTNLEEGQQAITHSQEQLAVQISHMQTTVNMIQHGLERREQ